MKSTRRVMSSAAIVAIIAFVCLLALPSLAVARTIKGHIVDVVAENIGDRKSTRLNSSHLVISYAVFCLKKKNMLNPAPPERSRWVGHRLSQLHRPPYDSDQ